MGEPGQPPCPAAVVVGGAELLGQLEQHLCRAVVAGGQGAPGGVIEAVDEIGDRHVHACSAHVVDHLVEVAPSLDEQLAGHGGVEVCDRTRSQVGHQPFGGGSVDLPVDDEPLGRRCLEGACCVGDGRAGEPGEVGG